VPILIKTDPVLLENILTVNSYVTSFDAPDVRFYNLFLFSDAQAEKVGNPKNN
jgi:hypothetical protein